MADERNESERRHMPEAVDLRGVLVGGASIAGAIAFALVAAFAVIHLGSSGAPHVAARAGKPPPVEGGIVLQPDPAQDIRAFTTEKRRLLDGYGWVDREHTIARVPIQRAMELLDSEPKR